MSRLGSLWHAFAARLSGALLLAGLAWLAAVSPWAAATPLAYANSVITVNSAADNVEDDGVLTLREAICLAVDTGGGTPIGTGTDCGGSPRDPDGGEAGQVSVIGSNGLGESDQIRFSGNFTIEVDCANLGGLPYLSDVGNGFPTVADIIDGSGHTIKIRPGNGCANEAGLVTTPLSANNTIRGIQVLRRDHSGFLAGVVLQGDGNRVEAGDNDTACHIQGPGGEDFPAGAVLILGPGSNNSVDSCELDGGPAGVLVGVPDPENPVTPGPFSASVTNNNIHDNLVGVFHILSSGGGIAGNRIEHNELYGIGVVASDPSDRVLVGTNEVHHNDGPGLIVFQSLVIAENNSFSLNKRLGADLHVPGYDFVTANRVTCGGGDGDDPKKIGGVPGIPCPQVTAANPASRTVSGTAQTGACKAKDGCLVEVYLAFDDGDNTGVNTTKPHGEGFQPLGFAPVDDDGNWSLTLPNAFARGDAFTALAFNPDAGVTSEFSPNFVVPGANLTATPTSTKAILTFSPPAASDECPIQSYLITVYRNNQVVKTVTTSSSPVTVDGLQNGQTYTFTLTATYCNGVGPESARSALVTVGQDAATPDGVFLNKATNGTPLSFGGDNVYDTSGGGGGGANVASGDGPRIVGSASIPFRIQNDGRKADRIKFKAIQSSRSLTGITITVNGLKLNDGTDVLAANGGKLDGNIVVKVASSAAKGNYVVRITLQANGSSDPAQSDSVTLRFKV